MRPCLKAAVDALAKSGPESPFRLVSDISQLLPHVREKFLQWRDALAADGINVRVVETFRSYTRQKYLYERAGGATKAPPGCSWHQLRRAWDAYPLRKDGTIAMHYAGEDAKLFDAMGRKAEALGIEWGGRWRSIKDFGHFQVTDGLTIDQAAELDLTVAPVIAASAAEKEGRKDEEVS